MTSKLKLLVATSAVSVAMLGANPAFAAGTASGTDITNTVTVNYNVGGVAQTVEDDTDTFTVDRKIDLTVAEVGTTSTSVSPGQTDAVTTFTVTNTSNATLDFGLSAAQLAGGTAAHGGADNFNFTSLAIYVDSNNNGTYESGTDTATFIDELAADTSATVFVVGNIPGTQSTGDVAGVNLTAQAKESGAAATEGAVVTQTAGANTASVDTVFADGDGPGTETARDGRHSAGDDYTVDAADISVTKTSSVLWDPVNGSTNPKAIPGAVVEYCIAVANAPGSATATGVSISDTIPANLTYYSTLATGPATIPTVNGVISALACDGTGTNGDATLLQESGGTVSGNLGAVAAGVTETLIFRVTVD